MEEEKTLIQQAQSGDVAAFEQLIAEHQKRIFSIAYRVAGNPDDAADMAQKSWSRFLKISINSKAIPSFRPGSTGWPPIPAWMN